MKYFIQKTFFILSFLVVCSTYGQTTKYRFKNFSAADGLSQSSVIAIHQDKLGQMWFGTRDGLNKFDGSKFTVYRYHPTDGLSLSNNDILAITEDHEGKIWVGTYNGLNIYDPVKDRFTRYFHTNNKYSLSNNAIWCVTEIKDKMWIGTSKGLTIFDKKTKTFKNYFHQPNNSSSLPSNFILSITTTPKGAIWIGTSKGLCEVMDINAKTLQFKTKFDDVIESVFVQTIITDKKGNLWIGTKNKGLFRLDAKSNAVTTYQKLPGYTEIGMDVRALTIDQQGRLWIGNYNGISIIENDKTVYTIRNNDNPKIDKVKSLYTDKKGSVWIGTYYKGTNLWDISNNNFTSFNQSKGEFKLGYDVVSSITSDNHNNIYFGTEGGGVTVYNKISGKTSYIENNTDIKALHFSKNGILWMGTFSNGISAYNTKTKHIVTNSISEQLQNILKITGVYAIKEDKNGILWLGTFGKGLIRYDLSTKSFQTISTTNSAKNSLTSNRIRTILIDAKKQIWVGTQSGLNVLSTTKMGKKHQVKHYFFDNNVSSGDDILTLFTDKQENIWVGTKAKGLFILKKNQFKKVVIDAKNGSITTIHAILQDNNQNLWLSTNQGIIKYQIRTQKTTIYDQKDGLVSNEFNDNACLQIGNNDYYFGGPSGVTYFNSQKIALNNFAPKVIVTNLTIRDELVTTSSDNEILEKNISYTDKITLPYDKANFSISFSMPNFIRSKNNQYRYRLLGLEDSWITTKNNEVSFAIQNAGNYALEIMGANNDGVWNTTPTVLRIEVTPAPWRSNWALLLYSILIVLSVYGLIWIMKSKDQLKQKLEFEYIEAERIKENNLAKLEFFTNISHEFRTPLTLISGPLQQILADYSGSNEMYKKLLVIESSSNHLLNLINRLMDFRKLENNQFTLESAKGNIVKFTREIFLSFEEYAKDGHYDFSFESSHKEIIVYFDRYKLERVVFNLISNAFRYTPKGGKIKISLHKEKDGVRLDVEDSGVGIAPEHISKIFDLFFEVPMHNQVKNNYNKGTGIGLSIVKNIVKLHHGTVSVVNKETEGVVFSVVLPKGKKHLSESEIIQDFKISDDISQYTSQLTVPADAVEQDDLKDLIIEEDKPTILVVEDHKELRSFIKNILKEDYNIITADNGKSALKKAVIFLPTVVVSDVIMPEMVGTELCAKIKENPLTSHIPVILLTSRSSLIYKFEGLNSGADDYISKPFNLIEFKLRIKNIIESSQRLKDKFTKEDAFTPTDVVLTSVDDELLKKAFKIVEENIANNQFDIPQFCSELGVSRTMLFLKIKTWTDCTPNEFIHEIRLKAAAQLLEQHKINISQVSYKVGFNNPKYFSKCFQKKYGITPSEYSEKFYSNIL
ncbi:hybrid sensor histidine kinase/response regulator transcription factor [Flavobacterium fluviatile]|uniref:hybrid sensor histidine kinase/response regulator transcription factor n=1 Tax=Flavobacterium fluviatile TaxID=1862387 RepID=UPI0013D30E20|nr:two-component regulator propeller domain-containing protein [Flavobacterium fluviatile]